MQDLSLIKYKWNKGVYDLKKMIELVKNKNINKKQFFKITRCHFDAVAAQNNK